MDFLSKQFSSSLNLQDHCPASEEHEVACQDCGLDPICDELDYAEPESGVPEGILLRRRSIERGETLFRAEDPFHSIFAVKSGSFKTQISTTGGSNTVIGFHLPGELIGTEAYSDRKYTSTARALENSSVCELRIDRLPESRRPLQNLQRAIIELLSQDIAAVRSINAELIRQGANQRVAAFLLGFVHRLESRGMPSNEFRLTMSRRDIASYLGLASETVSRIMTRFNKEGLINTRGKRTRVIDLKHLQEIAENA